MTDERMPSAAPAATPGRAPGVEPPSDDVAVAPAGAGLPGEHRGGFQRALTQPTPITQPVHTEVRWAPTPEPLPTSGVWALGLAIVGLALSLVVGWAFPVGLTAAVLAVLALRRPWEKRAVAVWALVLAVVSLIYSAGWLVWAAFASGLFG